MRPRRALLLSGGIGDYLHYLVRLDDFLTVHGLAPSDVTIFVESTRPPNVRELFAVAFPDHEFRFAAAAIHWTKVNPLLDCRSEWDQINRPAYRYVKHQGFTDITDWFLPFRCAHHRVSLSPLHRIVQSVAPADILDNPYVVVSNRDKGFLWWPTPAGFAVVERAVPRDHTILYLGTPDERLDGQRDMLTTPEIRLGLVLSLNAQLFVGTDTGLATIRELLGRKNIYCVNDYWLRELMVAYAYMDLAATKSEFAFDVGQLARRVTAHFVPSDTPSPATVTTTARPR